MEKENKNVKVTKADNFNEIIAIAKDLGRDDLVKFCEHEIELLNKKKNGSSNNKKVMEMENLKADVLTAFRLIDGIVTISEAQKKNDFLATLSNQKISAILKKLIEDEKMVRTEEKGKAYFSIK